MARGSGTRKMMSNDDVSKLIRGDKDALGQVAKKGGNAVEKVDTTKFKAPNEEELAKQMGVDVKTIRLAYYNYLKQQREWEEAKRKDASRNPKPAEVQKEVEKKNEQEKTPWYMRSGSGPRFLFHSGGRGGSEGSAYQGGGGSEPASGGGADDKESLINRLKNRPNFDASKLQIPSGTNVASAPPPSK
jgi:hypothetical protein